MPAAKELIGDRGSDSTPFREGLAARGITACIPSKKSGPRDGAADQGLAMVRSLIFQGA